MTSNHKGENWPYHEDKHGNMVPCASNPCKLHGSSDIMASSPEDAYAQRYAGSESVSYQEAEQLLLGKTTETAEKTGYVSVSSDSHAFDSMSTEELDSIVAELNEWGGEKTDWGWTRGNGGTTFSYLPDWEQDYDVDEDVLNISERFNNDPSQVIGNAFYVGNDFDAEYMSKVMKASKARKPENRRVTSEGEMLTYNQARRIAQEKYAYAISYIWSNENEGASKQEVDAAYDAAFEWFDERYPRDDNDE